MRFKDDLENLTEFGDLKFILQGLTLSLILVRALELTALTDVSTVPGLLLATMTSYC